jgi:acetyl-CoA carboxylase biotin carboxylase subunit
MSFERVLIANRGEIACRLIRACRSLDLEAVAVYSEADKNAPFVSLANSAVAIGASEASKSYLDMGKIIDAAKTSGATAVHPGYGFLAESAEFARLCTENSLKFIGPDAAIIEKMGSKIEAKAIAIDANVPVIPGYQGRDQSGALLAEKAVQIGVPLMIKASAGGGGRGMRLVTDLAAFSTELQMAQQEAMAAFGDDAVLLEKYVSNGRHVEVQVLGDSHGNIVHLFERDCSMQRNHQKIIEEAPAPNLPNATRESMLASAISLCQKVGYDSAGTVEYMYDAIADAYYFLEMNTRLQVEHPVTEAVTGIDLAAWQIKIAMGNRLTLQQEEIKCNGWAMEARVAAEDPAQNYMPQTGSISIYKEPSQVGVRVDSGIQAGSYVSHYYDSMLAKVIAHSDTRDGAIRKLKKALQDLRISGCKTNQSFLLDIITWPEFGEASHRTNSLKTVTDEGWQAPVSSDHDVGIAVIAAYLSTQSKNSSGPWGTLNGWRNTGSCGRPSSFYYMGRMVDGDLRSVKIIQEEQAFSVFWDDKELLRNVGAEIDGSCLKIISQGQLYRYEVERQGTNILVSREGRFTEICLLPLEQAALSKSAGAAGSGNVVMAPMPGLVTELLVKEGQEVAAGEPVLVLEAMKLLQKLPATGSGIIEKIHCQVGDTPEKGAPLVTLELM